MIHEYPVCVKPLNGTPGLIYWRLVAALMGQLSSADERQVRRTPHLVDSLGYVPLSDVPENPEVVDSHLHLDKLADQLSVPKRLSAILDSVAKRPFELTAGVAIFCFPEG